jgi:ABC-type glycerol-3-phosphate transport system substrate-binding protein
MKRFRFMVLGLGITLALTSFSAWGQSQITLRILDGQSTTDAGIEKIIDAALAAKYPTIKLDWEIVGWGTDLNAKVQQYVQSGLPDIIVGKGQDLATYSSRKILAPITGKPYLKNVLDDAVKSATFNGTTYGVEFNALYQGVYYNRKIFKDNNLSIPKTQAELQALIKKLNSLGITPFATHFLDLWSIGNITMQFAINDIFAKDPGWANEFRAGKISYATSPDARAIYAYNKLLYDNTWKDETFSLEQTKADARLVQGKAAMKVSGSWSIQNFLDVDPSFDFGVFPFPNRAGNAKLIFEPNITFMRSATTKYSDAVDKVFEVITSDKDAAQKIYDLTKTAPLIKGVTPSYTNPSQKDIDAYAAKGQLVDANTGNLQLVWGGFQDENAKDIAAWLQGSETLDQALKAADSRRAVSKP